MAGSISTPLVIMLAVLALAATLLVVTLMKLRRARALAEAVQADSDEKLQRYSGLISLDEEAVRISSDIEASNQELTELRMSYSEKRATYDRLTAELAIYDDRLAFAEMGVYEPHFEFTDSEEYKAAIAAVRDQQKRMISDKSAVFCTTKWHVEGSLSKGQTMTNRNIRLTLRAFNNEGDAAVANTRWNNVNAMSKRVLKAQEQIDKLNASNAVLIDSDYVKLKLQELFLTHEYREKVKSERDERAEGLRLARDEVKLLRDMERAQEQEEYYARLLAKAQVEAEGIVGPQLAAFSEQIQKLEADLAEARAKAERARAMAEQTRSGYVYIISNIGSFGDGVVKIGMTRRLDPMDRVRELGDASVPFTFDIHAIIYSDDAPTLERSLHGVFEATRINAQNYRKEFFRASIEDVEEAVSRLAPGSTFFKDIEAQEYRETLSRRRLALQPGPEQASAFPAEL